MLTRMVFAVAATTLFSVPALAADEGSKAASKDAVEETSNDQARPGAPNDPRYRSCERYNRYGRSSYRWCVRDSRCRWSGYRGCVSRYGGGYGRGLWQCTARDQGWEEHWGGHTAQGYSRWDAARAALRICQQPVGDHGRCTISSCRQIR